MTVGPSENIDGDWQPVPKAQEARPPELTFVMPDAVSGTFHLHAIATDNVGVDRVEYFVDDSLLGVATDAGSDYELAWDTATLEDGRYTVTAVAYDTSENSASQETSVVVDNTLPTVDWTSPADGDQVSGVVPLHASASDFGSGVVSLEFGVRSGTSGPFDTIAGTGESPLDTSWDTAGFNEGTAQIQLVVRDRAGNSVEKIVTVDVANALDALVVASAALVDSVDPAVSSAALPSQLQHLTCATLLGYPDANGPRGSTPEPEVAVSMPEVTDGGLTYSFRLRDDYRLSDGASISAFNFVRAFERVLRAQGVGAGLVDDLIVGAKEYEAGAAETIAGIKAPDRSTLVFHLTRPSASFLPRLGLPYFCPVPLEAPPAPSPVPLPGSGPYSISDYTPGEQIVFSRNPYYPGIRPRNFRQIVVRLGYTQADALEAVESGAADYLAGPPPTGDLARLDGSYGPASPAAKDGHQQFFVNKAAGVRYLALNSSRGVFSNVLYRKAVQYALDRPALAATVSPYLTSPTDQFVADGIPGFRDADLYPLGGPDLARARELVDQAGGAPDSTVVVYTCTSPVCVAQGEIVQRDLEAIGFTVEVSHFPRAEQVTREQTRGEPFDIGLESWLYDFPDPFDTLNVFFDGTTITDTGNLDVSYFDDAEVNAALHAADALLPPDRYAAYADLEESLLRDKSPAAAWGTFNSVDFFSDRIGCQLFASPFGIDLAALCDRRHAVKPTGVVAQLTSEPTVEAAAASVAISDISLSAFLDEASTAGSVGGAPIQNLSVGGAPIQNLPIQNLPIQNLPIQNLPIQNLPIQNLPIQNLPIQNLPIQNLPIQNLGVDWPGGWTAILAGTPLADVPLQTVTLPQVLALSPTPPALDPSSNPHVTLGSLDLSQSALGQVPFLAFALGNATLDGLGLAPGAELTSWCTDNAGPPLSCTSTRLGSSSTAVLAIEGAPIQNLPIQNLPIQNLKVGDFPIQNLPIQNLPIQNLDTSASPIQNLPIQNLDLATSPIFNLAVNTVVGAGSRIGSLPIQNLPAVTPPLVDCTGHPSLDCATGTLADAVAAGAVSDSVTLADLYAVLNGFTVGDVKDYGDITIGEFVHGLPATTTWLELVAILIPAAEVPWEELSPDAVAQFAAERSSLALHAHFTLTGAGVGPAKVSVTLPAGFDYAPGSSKLVAAGQDLGPLPDPAQSGQTAVWTIPGATFGDTYRIDFRAFSGSTIGATSASESVSATGVSDSADAPFTVGDTFEPNGDALTAPTLQPNDAVQISYVASAGDVDYYRVPFPAKGVRFAVHLANLPADYDLALMTTRTTALRPTAAAGPTLQDPPIRDAGVDLQGTNPSLEPGPLQDVPDAGLAVLQLSSNRGTEDEDVGAVSPGGAGFFVIAVFGYSGAHSNHAYTMRVQTFDPVVTTCPARSFDAGGTGLFGVAGTLPSLASLPPDLNAVFLVNEKRLGDTYGRARAATLVTALSGLATGQRNLGVSGAVIPVESIPGVDYAPWDANPCDNDAANAVAAAIASEIDAIKAARPTLKYVTVVGGDDEVPFFRIADLTRIANEAGFANTLGRNQYWGAAAGGFVLSDDPYFDTDPMPLSGGQIFLPDLAGGRLVETPEEMSAAIARFVDSGGKLAADSAFVSGYDFVRDGSEAVQAGLDGILGAGTTRTLISDGWSKAQLDSAAFPPLPVGAAAINDWNGHYDQYRALMADGTTLFTTADLDAKAAGLLENGIFFTLGCHAGNQETDVIVGSSFAGARDWAQAFSDRGTSFVGNTGYGLGNTDSVAFGEELLAHFAEQLDGSASIGTALARAKANYFLSRTAYSSYDEKTLAEAELYGLPFFGVGTAPAPLGSPVTPPASPSPDPVRGTTASTSPSEGALSPLPGTSAQTAQFAVTPHFDTTPHTGAHGNWFSNDGLVQAPNYWPLQPYVSLPATRALAAHGVILDSAEARDMIGFDPSYVRPTFDQTSTEPEPQFDQVAAPSKIPTLVSALTPDGPEQQLNLSTGQFFTTDSGSGVQRLWTQLDGRVTYSASPDFAPPSVDEVNAFLLGGIVTFSARFSDRTETGAPGTVAIASVVYDADNQGHWRSLALSRDPDTGAWSASAPFAGAHVQYFVLGGDPAGNIAYSTNKARYFDAQPLPQQAPGGITFAPSGGAGANGWFHTDVSVGLTPAQEGSMVEYSLDGGPFRSEPVPVPVTGDGAHTLEARGSDGSTGSTVVLVDETPPAVELSPADGDVVARNAVLVAHFSCADVLSGVASCTATVDGAPVADGDALPTGTGGTHEVVVRASDVAGNSRTVTHHYTVNRAPTAPGTPTLAAGTSPTGGFFTLVWSVATDADGDPLTYTLLHRDADDAAYSVVASGLTATSYTFAPEQEGTWTYQVTANDGVADGPAATSAAIVADETAPNAPTLSADRAPEFDTWFKDSVTVTTVEHGDPALRDGSAGSGVGSVTAPQTILANGHNVVTGVATDRAGRQASTSATFDVDSRSPTVTVVCPAAPLLLRAVASAPWSATDGVGSGVTTAAGTVPLDTSQVGSFTAKASATDSVGHVGTGTCTYSVVFSFVGFLFPVKNPPTINVVRAGRYVPLRFSLGGDQGRAIFAPGYPKSTQFTCPRVRTESVDDEDGLPPLPSVLVYIRFIDQYIYFWKTESSWVGTCRQFDMKLVDGTVHSALFRLR